MNQNPPLEKKDRSIFIGMKIGTAHGRRLLTGVLVVAFALRLAAGWAWQSRLDGRFGMGDSDSYWKLGSAIAQGQSYELGEERMLAFRTPGYPILLAPVIRFIGDGYAAIMVARAEAALFGTLAVLMVWWLTRLLFDDRTALLAAALAAFYPGAIVLSFLLLSEAPFCPLMLLQLVLWILAWHSPSPGRRAFFGISAGLAGGAATLMRPSWLLFTPLAAVMQLVMRTHEGDGGDCRKESSQDGKNLSRQPPPSLWLSKRREFVLACWILLGLGVMMSPWWIRNALVIGRFVPTTLQTGASLYDGLNPLATGSSNMDFVTRFQAEEQQRMELSPGEGAESLELRLDRRLRDESLAWVRANPGQAVQLAGIKFLRMWNVWPNEARFSSWPVRLAVLFTYTPLLIFAIIGGWRTFRRGWPYRLCWLPAGYLTLLHIIFVSSLRYREPAMLALLALAAAGILGVRGQGSEVRD
jgi:hypothetical protein